MRIKVELEFVTTSRTSIQWMSNVLRGEFEQLRAGISKDMHLVEWGSKFTFMPEEEGVVIGEPPLCIQCKRPTSFVRAGVYQCENLKCRKYGRAVVRGQVPEVGKIEGPPATGDFDNVETHNYDNAVYPEPLPPTSSWKKGVKKAAKKAVKKGTKK